MKKTIISCVVAVICTAALCITYAVSTPDKDNSKVDGSAYFTEQEAAEYIGVTDEIMVLMREKLKVFEGAYMSYTYVDEKGDDVNILVYNKDALDDVIEGLMKDQNKYNFKYIQEVENSKK